MTDILGKARAVQLSEITLYDACVFAHFCDLRKLRQKVELMIRDIPMEDNGLLDDKREEFSRGVNRELTDYHGYYHGVSTGVSKTNLVDYYYPEDTHMIVPESTRRDAIYKKQETLRQISR